MTPLKVTHAQNCGTVAPTLTLQMDTTVVGALNVGGMDVHSDFMTTLAAQSTAWTLTNALKRRMAAHDSGTHDGSVDLLITGCEVSLWAGEQFASDLHNAFPKLKVVTLSANKLLAQLGQAFPVPNTGFYFNETSYDFTNTIVLLLSHSG